MTYTDAKIDLVLEKAISMKESVVGVAATSKTFVGEYVSGIVARYNVEKSGVFSKAKEYKSAISEQINNVISESSVPVNGLKEKVAESVRQAPDMMRSISNKAVSLTKQGLEISIGQENTETVMNTVKTHTPKFVSSLLAMESTDAAFAEPTIPVAASVAAH